MDTLQNHNKNSRKTRDHLDSAKQQNSGTIVERYLEDEKYQMRTHTRNPTWKNLPKKTNEKRITSFLSTDWAYCTDQ